MKTCRVSWRDRGGVEHSVMVEAANRYQAFGLAMYQMRRCSWCNPDFREVQRMTVVLLATRQRIHVTREQFEQWIGPPRLSGDKLREHLLMLLRRIEPSREFRRMIGSH